MGAVLEKLELEMGDDYQKAAMTSPHELENNIDEAAKAMKIAMGQRLKVRTAFLVMRSAAGFPTASAPPAPSTTSTPTPSQSQPSIITSSAQLVAASMKPGEVSGGGLLALSKTVDQASELEVKMLDAKTLQ